MKNLKLSTYSENNKKVKLLITVKSPPYPSSTYQELVCTAGITEEGEWIRIVPVPFRYLDKSKKFKKFDWIELEVEKHNNDSRLETYRPIDLNKISVEGSIGTEENWKERRDLFANQIVRTLCDYIQIFRNKCNENKQYEAPSLFMVQPYQIIDFLVEEDDPNWKPEWKLLYEQETLFDEMKMKPLDKIPYKFSYKFKCDEKCKGHIMKIEDWEIYELARKYIHSKELIIEKVTQKYKNEFLTKRDLYFFIGSQLQWHKRKARNPYLIIGVFAPPKETQLNMFT